MYNEIRKEVRFMELKGSKTEQNLMKAFAGESQARNKYTYYASKAKKDGYVQISALFEETAENEKEHAKIWFKLLCDGEIKDTLTNLKDAAAGEYYEWTDMYKKFAKTAKEEGFEDISKLFNIIITVEKIHNKRFDKLIKDLEDDKIFKSAKPVLWECSNCGFHILSENAPEICPLCEHPKSYFFKEE